MAHGIHGTRGNGTLKFLTSMIGKPALRALNSAVMRQYRPTIEQLKKRYSSDMARRKMQERRDAARDPSAKRVKIPDNSEPWLPHPPRSVTECAWISSQVGDNIEQWKLTLPKIFSSAG